MENKDFPVVVGIRTIPDKAYTAEEIVDLFYKVEKEYIDGFRTAYDTPPFRFSDEQLALMVQLKLLDGPLEKELAIRDQHYEKMLREFHARPKFNAKIHRLEFSKIYGNALKHAPTSFPQFIRDEVDDRLLAMYLMPESTYAKYAQWLESDDCPHWEGPADPAEKFPF